MIIEVYDKESTAIEDDRKEHLNQLGQRKGSKVPAHSEKQPLKMKRD